MSADLLVRMEGIDKTFPGVQALDGRPVRAAPRRGARPRGRERRRQVHAHEDPDRHLPQGCRHHLVQGPGGRHPGPARRPRPGHQHDPPGTDPAAAPHGRPEHLHGPRATRAASPFMVDEKQQVAQTAELIDRLHLRLDPRTKVARSQGRPAADGRDRQGPLVRLVRAHHGRADGRPDRTRRSTSSSASSARCARKAWVSSTSRIASRSCGRSPIA